MGLDYIHALFCLEQRFGLPEKFFEDKNPVDKAGDLFDLIESFIAHEDEHPDSRLSSADLWHEFKKVLSENIVGVDINEIDKTSSLFRDLGFE